MEPDRPTRPTVELIPTVDEQPTPGARVLAIQHGGKLVETVWSRTSYLTFDAWMHFPKVPRKVKELQSSRFK